MSGSNYDNAGFQSEKMKPQWRSYSVYKIPYPDIQMYFLGTTAYIVYVNLGQLAWGSSIGWVA